MSISKLQQEAGRATLDEAFYKGLGAALLLLPTQKYPRSLNQILGVLVILKGSNGGDPTNIKAFDQTLYTI